MITENPEVTFTLVNEASGMKIVLTRKACAAGELAQVTIGRGDIYARGIDLSHAAALSELCNFLLTVHPNETFMCDHGGDEATRAHLRLMLVPPSE